MSRLILFAAALAACHACDSAAKAAEFRQDGLTLTMTGLIEVGDSQKLWRALKGPPPARFLLDSQGGQIEEAFAISDYVRQAHMVTEVDNECLSACVIIFGAGMQRWARPGARFAVHQAALHGAPSEAATTRLTWIYRVLKIPAQIIARMRATPIESMSDLSPDDLAAWQVKPKA